MKEGAVQLVTALVYVFGSIFWLYIWKRAKAYEVSKLIKTLWFPLLLVIFTFLIAALSVCFSFHMGGSASEEHLLGILENLSQQLITAIFGTLILAGILMSSAHKTAFTKNLLLFESLDWFFLVAGVLVIYWIPMGGMEYIFILRHIKTLFYTYSIGFFLSGLLILFYRLLESKDEELNFSQSKWMNLKPVNLKMMKYSFL